MTPACPVCGTKAPVIDGECAACVELAKQLGGQRYLARVAVAPPADAIALRRLARAIEGGAERVDPADVGSTAAALRRAADSIEALETLCAALGEIDDIYVQAADVCGLNTAPLRQIRALLMAL